MARSAGPGSRQSSLVELLAQNFNDPLVSPKPDADLGLPLGLTGLNASLFPAKESARETICPSGEIPATGWTT